MDFVRRLLGLGETDRNPDGGRAVGEIGAAPEPPLSSVVPQRPTAVACPSCAVLLDPPPVRNRLCPQCRQPIVVRHVDGRLALLNEAAVRVFEAERQRAIDEQAQAVARQRWLRLAMTVKASPARRAKLADAPLSAEVVRISRTLYLATAERAAKAARHEKRWGDVGRIVREQARALYEEAGAPVPPPDEIAEIHREGMTAVLRSLQPLAKDVELVSTGCCPACRADDGETFRIASEVRTARLPHAGCPRGLCGCDWWPAVVEPRKRRRRAPATGGPLRESPTLPLRGRPDDADTHA
jgi:hypothetical protein